MIALLKTKYTVGVCILLCAALSACSGNDTYHQFQDVKTTGWSKNDTLDFLVDTTTVTAGTAYDIQVEIVNNNQFPYQNLWLFVRSNVAGEKTFEQDTIQIKLADIYGKWLGSGFGSSYQLAIPLKTRIVFPQKRNYKFQIVQGMRDEPLQGIEKAGVHISRAE